MKKWTDYLGPEDHLHIQVVNYLRLQYPQVFFIHVPNEGKRTKFERWKFKMLGGTPGIPDIMIFSESPPGVYEELVEYIGLAIELKIRPNKPTDDQLYCLDELKKACWQAWVIYDFDDAKKVIDRYLK